MRQANLDLEDEAGTYVARTGVIQRAAELRKFAPGFVGLDSNDERISGRKTPSGLGASTSARSAWLLYCYWFQPCAHLLGKPVDRGDSVSYSRRERCISQGELAGQQNASNIAAQLAL